MSPTKDVAPVQWGRTPQTDSSLRRVLCGKCPSNTVVVLYARRVELTRRASLSKYLQVNIESPQLLADAGHAKQPPSTRPRSRRSAWASEKPLSLLHTASIRFSCGQ